MMKNIRQNAPMSVKKWAVLAVMAPFLSLLPRGACAWQQQLAGIRPFLRRPLWEERPQKCLLAAAASSNDDESSAANDEDKKPLNSIIVEEPSQQEWGVSYIGGDPCGSKYNTDPHDAQVQKPGMPDTMKARIQAMAEQRLKEEQQQQQQAKATDNVQE